MIGNWKQLTTHQFKRFSWNLFLFFVVCWQFSLLLKLYLKICLSSVVVAIVNLTAPYCLYKIKMWLWDRSVRWYVNVLWAALELRFFLAALDKAESHWLLPITWLSLVGYNQLAFIGCPRQSWLPLASSDHPGAHWLPPTNWLSLAALDKADCHWLLPVTWRSLAASNQLALIGCPRQSWLPLAAAGHLALIGCLQSTGSHWLPSTKLTAFGCWRPCCSSLAATNQLAHILAAYSSRSLAAYDQQLYLISRLANGLTAADY